MSASYVGVGWNPQKKIYDTVIAVLCLLYLGLFTGITLLINPDVTFETLFIRATSTVALFLLHIILAIGPLCRLNRKFLPLLYNRRHLGVTMFSFALAHGLFSVFQFHGLGNVNPLISLFTSNTDFFSLSGFPFQLLGFLALVILFLMAITSHDFWLHNLSPRVWKTIHMLVYLSYFLVVMHVMLGVIQYEKNPVLVVLLFSGMTLLVSLHLAAACKEKKLDRQVFQLLKAGFVRVCAVQEMVDSRARLFCIGKERIAVYRHGAMIFAVHNFCKHQGGPLGEGKIIDGCITCPWHGYQYLPHNGQSPPPFKEKVSTYEVKILEGDIWINPHAYPEGTEQTGAIIKV